MGEHRGNNKIYENSQFIILSAGREFILMNKKKPFKTGHTHLRSLDTAKWLIRMSRTQTIPHHISSYLLESLIRISVGADYVNDLKTLKSTKYTLTQGGNITG